MDSTIIGQECLDEVAASVGVKPQVAAITERAMRGEMNFAEALHERINLLHGLPESALAEVLDQRISLNPGARELVGTMRAHGAHTVLVSGGFTFFTGAVAERAGFHSHRGNTLVFADGKLTGVGEPILGRDAKRETLLNTQARRISTFPTPWPWVTVRTTSPCWSLPGWASLIMPSPSSRLRPTPASGIAISPPYCICKVIRKPLSRSNDGTRKDPPRHVCIGV